MAQQKTTSSKTHSAKTHTTDDSGESQITNFTNPSGAAASLVPRLHSRDAREHKIHTFKMKVATMVKNRSLNRRQFTPEKFEHTHIFHSHSERGTANQYTVATGGHFHPVELSYNPDGTILSAKCGPPVWKKEKQVDNEVRTYIEPVEWEVRNGKDRRGGATVEQDLHTHEFEYLGSETFSNQKKKDILASNAAELPPLERTASKPAPSNAAEIAGMLQDAPPRV